MGTWGLLIALYNTHTHTQCSLYNPKSPAPRSSPKLSPRSNNDLPSLRRRFPTAKVVSKVVAKKQQRSTVASAKISHGQGRLQSCRQEATTIYRRFGEDFPRQRWGRRRPSLQQRCFRYDLQSRVLLHDG